MLDYALSVKKPIAIRYPNGVVNEDIGGNSPFKKEGEWEIIQKGERVAIFAVGPRMLALAKHCAKAFEDGEVAVVSARSVKPIDGNAIASFSDATI